MTPPVWVRSHKDRLGQRRPLVRVGRNNLEAFALLRVFWTLPSFSTTALYAAILGFLIDLATGSFGERRSLVDCDQILAFTIRAPDLQRIMIPSRLPSQVHDLYGMTMRAGSRRTIRIQRRLPNEFRLHHLQTELCIPWRDDTVHILNSTAMRREIHASIVYDLLVEDDFLAVNACGRYYYRTKGKKGVRKEWHCRCF